MLEAFTVTKFTIVEEAPFTESEPEMYLLVLVALVVVPFVPEKLITFRRVEDAVD